MYVCKRMIMRVNKKPVWPTGNWTDSSIFSDERRIKESWSRSQSLLPLPDLSRKIEGDSARRVSEWLQSSIESDLYRRFAMWIRHPPWLSLSRSFFLQTLFLVQGPDYMANFSPGWNFNPANRAEILLRLHDELQPGLYEISREESRENQAAILFPAFQPGLNFLFDYMRFLQPGAKFRPGWKS